MHYFSYKKNQLFCEDVNLAKIASKYGTPVYVYSQRTIVEHLEKIKKAFKKIDPIICYSVKANSNLSILKLMVKHGSGLDIVSGGELFRAKKAKCSMKKIVYASVGKTDQEIIDGLKAKILLFNVESEPELERINNIAKKLNIKGKQSVALRVNPDVEAKTHAYITTGKKETKFGLDIATAERIFLNQDKYPQLCIDGIHIHIGSQITDPKPYEKAIKRMCILIDFLNKQGVKIKYFDLGGGMGIIYDNEKAQTAKAFAKKMIPLLSNINAKVILEPGRFIVGNAGVLVTKVLYVKQSYNKRFVIVDAAMNDLIRPALYQAYHNILPIKKETAKAKIKVDVVGPICESGDFLGKQRNLKVEQSDLCAVMSAGAYGFTMSSNYNSRPRAAEVLVTGKTTKLIRKRETYDDLINKEIIK